MPLGRKGSYDTRYNVAGRLGTCGTACCYFSRARSLLEWALRACPTSRVNEQPLPGVSTAGQQQNSPDRSRVAECSYSRVQTSLLQVMGDGSATRWLYVRAFRTYIH